MTTSRRAIAVHIVLAAMLLRAIIPAGWMPNPGGAGQTPFVVCSLAGLQTLPAQSGDPAKTGTDHSSRNICPFAAAAHLAPTTIAPVFLPPHSIFAAAHLPARAQTIIRPALDQASPRGPPALA